ncbi:caspase-3-like [Saccostrea echinata]|uniref:caspase-3-like n=1 Tax=Saccostrea echinata TaxID=191078 RepID=UPI002A7FDBAE|nr:caspase-3-like [Saccostrea echinata]
MGIAVVIINKTFSGTGFSNRPGSEKDLERIKISFRKLDLKVLVFEDLKHCDMIAKLENISKKYHFQYDLFMCCIMSHGDLFEVFGVDGKSVEIRTLTDMFGPKQCPSLREKPKVFIIQACQGPNFQHGSVIQVDRARRLNIATMREMIPESADFLLGVSTIPGYLSLRNTSKGSWYIQSLCDILDKHGCRLGIHEILLEVNRQVSKMVKIEGEERYMQMPAPVTTLRGDFIMNPNPRLNNPFF